MIKLNGILGLAPDEPNTGNSFIGAMRDQELIDEEIATFWLNDKSIGSKVTFGGFLSESIWGTLYDVKLDTYDNEWWTVDVTRATFGKTKFDNVTKAILDTGTSFILLTREDYLTFTEWVVENIPGVICPDLIGYCTTTEKCSNITESLPHITLTI